MTAIVMMGEEKTRTARVSQVRMVVIALQKVLTYSRNEPFGENGHRNFKVCRYLVHVAVKIISEQ